MSQCIQCLLDLGLYPELEGGRCPNCGRVQERQASRKPFTSTGEAEKAVATNRLVPSGPGSAFALLQQFFNDLRLVVFHPGRFFSSNAALLSGSSGLSSALTFAVVVQWLAAFFNFVWTSSIGTLVQGRIEDLVRIASDVTQTDPAAVHSLDQLKENMAEFLFGAGAVVLTPFTTLVKLSIIALLVHVAVRFFMREHSDRPHSYATTLKTLAYASGPWILCVIPGVGMVLAWILTFAASVIGLKEVYRSTTTRSMLSVLFPELLFLTFVFGVLVVLLFLVFNVMHLVF
ncbi:MAG: hypothetical protein AB1540_13920 [Bdellovibrionota bacterium]